MNCFSKGRLAWVILIACVSLASRPAHGQGTFGSLPDPISSADLEYYAERLAMSDQQLLAVSEHHAHYLEAFRELRDRDIQRLLDEVQVLVRNFDFSQRRQVEQAMRTLTRIMLQIRTLDERLFDEMQAVLTEDQLGRLPRLRMARERARYSGEMTRGVDFLNPAVRVDLSAIVYDMNLSPEIMATVDPTLESYERRLTTAARALFETTTSMVLDTLKRLEEMGFTSGSPQEPRMALRLFEAFSEIWAEISADLLKEANEVASLQRNTFRSLASVLPYEAVRELQAQYYRRAYPEAASIGRVAMRQFDLAVQLQELSDQQLADIQAMALSHWQAQNRIANEVIDLLDARRRDLSIRDIVRRNEDERQQAIDVNRHRAEVADEAALSMLHSVLGEELTERVKSGRGIRGATATVRTQRGGRSVVRDVDAGDPFIGRLPGRISPDDINRYCDALGLDERKAVIVDSMHEDYLNRFDALNETHLTPLRAAAREMAAMGVGFGNVSPEDAKRCTEIFALQRAAFDALRELDESFFDDVKAIVSAEQAGALQRLRLERERLAYTGGTNRPRTNMWGGSGGRPGAWQSQSSESNIDLRRLADELRLDISPAEDALLEYERKATDLFREKYHAELQIYQTMRTIDAQQDRRAFRTAMASSRRISSETNRALVALNRAALAALRHTLPAESAHYLQHYYRRLAFPAVYDDEGAATEKIAAALNLPELSESQRSRLRELSIDYAGKYGQVAEQMYLVHESAVELEGDDSDRRNRGNREVQMQVRNQLERLRFERNEINESAHRQLRAILSDEQLQRLGGM